MRTATDITSPRIGKCELHPAGIRQAVTMLQAGHLLLLCTCREYKRCHQRVVEMVGISIAPCFLLTPTAVRL